MVPKSLLLVEMLTDQTPLSRQACLKCFHIILVGSRLLLVFFIHGFGVE